MPLRVKLDDVISGLEFESDTVHSYLNKRTGEVIYITYDDLMIAEGDDPIDEYPEWQQDVIRLVKEVETTEDYLRLPDRFEIDEYHMMERFCLSIEDDKLCDYLYRAIKGRGAFRRFKDAVYRKGIEENWFAFRKEAYKQIALDWCKDNNIEVIE